MPAAAIFLGLLPGRVERHDNVVVPQGRMPLSMRARVSGTSRRYIVPAVTPAVLVMASEHVALGSDFDGAVTTTFDASQVSPVTQMLIEAG